ncbi:S-adenosyl-L-methionine-dependent methyltransferase [Thermoascus aurantiacus ATCC 26904]
MEQPHQGPAPAVEVDGEAPEQADSTYGDELSSYSTSLASNVKNYEWKHGRRYHSYQAGSYKFPNDDREQDRLDGRHHVSFRVLGDRLFLAPIKPDGMRILDMGTGIGIWPMQLGDMYPSAELIVGNDLSPIQPQCPNRIIHCRYMAASIRDWPKLVQQCYDNLKPGGWVEFEEGIPDLNSEDGTVKPDNNVANMLRLLGEACDKVGQTTRPLHVLMDSLEKVGFRNIEKKMFKVPVGTWPKDQRLKEIGAFMAMDLIDGVEAWTLVPFTEILGWSRQEVEVLNATVRNDVGRRDIHYLFDL